MKTALSFWGHRSRFTNDLHVFTAVWHINAGKDAHWAGEARLDFRVEMPHPQLGDASSAFCGGFARVVILGWGCTRADSPRAVTELLAVSSFEVVRAADGLMPFLRVARQGLHQAFEAEHNA